MSRTFHHGERRIRVRGVRKNPADLRRLAHALNALEEAQAETDAEAADKQRLTGSETKLPRSQDAGQNEKAKGDPA
jgi:hypothetical protein